MRLRAMTVLLPIGLLVAGMWSLRWILAVDQGLDLGDEALYILAATAPSPEYFWTNPWGWITRPLWQLTGERLDGFRWGGASLLLGSFTALTLSVFMAAARASGRRIHITPGEAAAAVPIGLAAALISYSGFLRSPGYNWVNLFGMTLTVAGALLWVTMRDRVTSRPADWFVAAVVAAGLVVSGIGKPTTPIFESACLLALGLMCSSGRQVRLLFARIAASAAVLLLCMWSVGWLGENPVDTVALVLRQPQLGSDQTLAGGALVSATVGLHLALWMAQYWYFTATVAAVSFALLADRRRSRLPGWFPVASLSLVCLMASGIWIGLLPAFSRGHNYMFRPEAVLATIGVLVVSLAVELRIHPSDQRFEQRFRAMPNRWRAAVVSFLCIQPVLYTFGSSIGPFQGMTWALGFLFLGAIFLMATLSHRPSTALTSVVAGTMIVGSGWGMIEGRDYPYGMKPIDQQTEAVNLGANNYPLLVDTDMRNAIVGLKEAAQQGQMPPGTDLATVVFQWSTLPPVVLGSDPPPSLMVSLFGSPYSAKIADFNAHRPPAGFDWRS
ncbi:MAG: hypothetical protein ACOYLU_15620, partial [Limisphaerales bacterium]